MIALDARVLAILVGFVASSIGCSRSSGSIPSPSDAVDAPSEAAPEHGSSRSGSGSSVDSAGAGDASASGGSGTSGSGGPDTGSSGSSSSGSVGAGTARGDGGPLWQPTAAAPIHFHWMIGGFTVADILPDQTGAVVYDIDGENSTAADVAAIHATGAIAVCYVDVGSLEKGRSDYSRFPSSVVGPMVSGWPDENWLLVTAANQAVILPLMKARFVNWCQAKGFDAIEPDNLDGWTNISNVSQGDNLAYDLAVSQLAHALPLSIGLKNLATDLSTNELPMFVEAFDWALNEQCYEYNECTAYTRSGSFVPTGKAVFDVEYNTSPNCAQANQLHINAQLTDLDLVGATASGYEYTPCVPDSQASW